MLNFRVRPRIRRFSDESNDQLLAKYQDIIDGDKYPVIGRVINHHVSIKMSAAEQHFWSPELS